MQYALDTNSILYYLRNQKKLDKNFMSIVEGSNLISLSIITKIELFSYPALQINEEAEIKGFIKDFIINELDDEIVEQTIKIRKKYKLKLPDAIIGATALVNNLVLITHNKKDFKKINGLKIIDPLY
ncbi:type II toxin-antitoxin system VapC family toxin [Candidatus Kuenenbacteria bacterium]|nr:type II toxin-antitoxin system VapC family toxin [Candidatus Kuenenbacteria bacterium]